MCTIMENVTPIGDTVAEISVAEQTEKQQPIYPSILTGIKEGNKQTGTKEEQVGQYKSNVISPIAHFLLSWQDILADSHQDSVWTDFHP